NVAGWKRPVVLLGLLPWFNPEIQGNGQHPTGGRGISMNQTLQNASDGIRALARLVDGFDEGVARATSEQGVGYAAVATTTVCLVGPPITTAQTAPPPSPDAVERTHRPPPFIGAVVDILDDLILERRNEYAEDEQRVFFGAVAKRVDADSNYTSTVRD